MVSLEQETVVSSATETVTTSRSDQKEDATIKKPNFYDVPFDIRILMWKGTLQDNTPAVLARATLRAGNEYIQPDTLGTLYLNEFILEIVPDKRSAAELAATILQPDMADRTFLDRTLQAAQQEIFASSNILFISDITDIFQPIRDTVLEREKICNEARRHDMTWKDDSQPRDPLTMLGGIQPKLVVECRAQAQHLAFYAFPYDPPHSALPKDSFINTRLMLQILQWMKELRTLYIVVDTRGFAKTPGSGKPRFVPGITGLGRSSADPISPENQVLRAAFKKSLMAQYHHAWRLKQVIDKEVFQWNCGKSGGEPLHSITCDLWIKNRSKEQRGLEVKIVQCER